MLPLLELGEKARLLALLLEAFERALEGLIGLDDDLRCGLAGRAAGSGPASIRIEQEGRALGAPRFEPGLIGGENLVHGAPGPEGVDEPG